MSVTVTFVWTLVSPPAKTQKLELTGRPSTIFTITSTLSGLKNQKSPASGVRRVARPAPARPSAAVQELRTRKRPPERQSVSASGAQAPPDARRFPGTETGTLKLPGVPFTEIEIVALPGPAATTVWAPVTSLVEIAATEALELWNVIGQYREELVRAGEFATTHSPFKRPYTAIGVGVESSSVSFDGTAWRLEYVGQVVL